MNSLDFSQFDCLTFDCYGTLIDWEAGILSAIQPVLRDRRLHWKDEEVLALFAKLESAAEREQFRPYREILSEVMRGFGRRIGFTPTGMELEALPDSLGDWQPFPDAVAALEQLKRRFRLGIISNVDDDLFAQSAMLLKVPFDWIITAQQASSYKPSLHNFEVALERIGLPPSRVCHVAQSLYHDIETAQKMGLATVWINRRHGRQGSGATPPTSAVRPDAEFPDLKSLAAAAMGPNQS